jgi:hypothetical protein
MLIDQENKVIFTTSHQLYLNPFNLIFCYRELYFINNKTQNMECIYVDNYYHLNNNNIFVSHVQLIFLSYHRF